MRVQRGLLAFSLVCSMLGATAHAAPDMFAERPGSVGFLYEVTPKKGGTGKVFLFGTIHVGTEAMSPFSHVVKAAIDSSQRVAFEIDPSDMGGMTGAMVKVMRNPIPGDAGRDLPAAMLDDAQKLLAGEGVTRPAAENMPIWLMGIMLGLAEVKPLGLSASYGADQYLAAYAKLHGLPILSLETPELQFRALSSLSVADQIETLRIGLADHHSGKSARKLKALVAAWSSGDDKSMRAEMLEEEQGKTAAERNYFKALLADRNVGMVKRAEELVAEGKTTFIAIGAAHLFGKTGLVEQLGKHGYAIRPIH